MGPRVAFVSTYPPRRCGIATFARDLAAAVGDREIIAIHRSGDPVLYPHEVTGLVRADERSDYLRAADRVSASGVAAVSIQHEYGLFGGQDGAFILEFVDRVQVPVVATLHTVLRQPSASQRDVMSQLVDRTSAVVVMSEAAARLLRDGYGAQISRTRVIPHGVPDLPFVDSELRKRDFGLEGRSVILSFGLLGPGKGYEHAIEAMSRVRRERPDALYVVLGATHPNLIRTEGEAYRDRLRKTVNDLGLSEHVLFVDRFVGQNELGRWLQAADIFVTPYPNLEQIVSGTLSYALAAGRPVVSTPFAYASEVLSGGRGVLVAPNSLEALAEALSSLLGDGARRREIGRRAYAFSRGMIWPEVGAAYRALFAQVARSAEIARGAGVPFAPALAVPVPTAHALVAHG
jgi:glycosyltransferase involved in cell wall biosynthesis